MPNAVTRYTSPITGQVHAWEYTRLYLHTATWHRLVEGAIREGYVPSAAQIRTGSTRQHPRRRNRRGLGVYISELAYAHLRTPYTDQRPQELRDLDLARLTADDPTLPLWQHPDAAGTPLRSTYLNISPQAEAILLDIAARFAISPVTDTYNPRNFTSLQLVGSVITAIAHGYLVPGPAPATAPPDPAPDPDPDTEKGR